MVCHVAVRSNKRPQKLPKRHVKRLQPRKGGWDVVYITTYRDKSVHWFSSLDPSRFLFIYHQALALAFPAGFPPLLANSDVSLFSNALTSLVV